MSTRATYLFNGFATVCFYLHHDGYPEGAANYFRQMIRYTEGKGGFAERFMRGNVRAELTGGHHTHCDTEFRYTMQADGFLVAEARKGWGDDEQWSGFFAGHVSEFVNRYDPEDGKQIVQLKRAYGTGGEWMELDAALAKLDELRCYAIGYMCKFGPSGNASGAFSDYYAAGDGLREHLSDLESDRIHTAKDIVAEVEHYRRDVLERVAADPESAEAECVERGLEPIKAPAWSSYGNKFADTLVLAKAAELFGWGGELAG